MRLLKKGYMVVYIVMVLCMDDEREIWNGDLLQQYYSTKHNIPKGNREHKRSVNSLR